MSQSVNAKIRVWSLVLSALICISGLSWGVDLHLGGQDIVAADGGGANVLAAGKGEDLLCGDMPDRYPWPTSPTTLTVEVVAAQDTGWVVVEGLDASGTEDADSVRGTGAGLYSIPGTWWRVNLARLRSDSTNTATISVLAGSTVLATIPPRHRRSCADHYTVPADKRQVIPKAWRVTPVPTSASADSQAVGVAAVVGRPRGGAWEILDRATWSTRTGDVTFVYPPTQWDLGPLADLVVPAGSTGASTLIESRMQFETR